MREKPISATIAGGGDVRAESGRRPMSPDPVRQQSVGNERVHGVPARKAPRRVVKFGREARPRTVKRKLERTVEQGAAARGHGEERQVPPIPAHDQRDADSDQHRGKYLRAEEAHDAKPRLAGFGPVDLEPERYCTVDAHHGAALRHVFGDGEEAPHAPDGQRQTDDGVQVRYSFG